MSILQLNYNYKRAKTYSNRIKFLVLHYTAENFEHSIKDLTDYLSVHYLVSLNKQDDPSYPFEIPQIFNLVEEKRCAWHAGISTWQHRTNLNDTSIGIEIVNLVKTIEHFLPFPQYQIHELVIPLCQNIIARYPDIKPTHIIGHSDITYTKKSDPGPTFPWKTLYDAGVGAWYDAKTLSMYISLIDVGKVNIDDAITKIVEYGYAKPNTTQEKMQLIRAVQLHFRPSNYYGKLDVETAAIMFALWKKYVAT